MTGRHALSAVVLLLAVVIAILAARWADGDAPALPGPPAGAPQTGAPEPDASGTAAPDQHLDRRPAAALPGASADPAAPLPPLRVRVVLPGGLPAQAAELWYWPPRGDEQRRVDEALQQASRDLEAILHARGERAVADADGIVVFAPARARCSARLGDHYGELDLEQELDRPAWSGSPHELQLELRRDATLRVVVVDDEGTPRPDLALQAEGRYQSRSIGTEQVDYPDLPPTDERGESTFPHLQCVLPLPGEAVLEWSLQVRCIGEHLRRCAVQVAPAQLLAGEQVRLVVPAGGDVIVDVVDADGGPLNQAPFLSDEEHDLCCTTTTADYASPFLFRQVPTGHRWQVVLMLDGPERNGPRDRVHREFAGPERAGESVRVRLQVDRRRWLLTGRIRRQDGIALDGATIALSAAAAEHAVAANTTMRGGTFRLALTTRGVESLEQPRLRVEHPALGGERVLELPGPLRAGNGDLGEFVVPAPAGEVLLASVEVRLAGEVVTSASYTGLYTIADGGRRIVATWDAWDGPARTFHGVPPAEPLYVVCEHPEALPFAQRAIAVGERVVIELRAAAELRVPVVAPPLPAQFIYAQLVPLPSEADGGVYGSWEDGRGIFWKRLPPGTYRLVVLAGGQPVFAAQPIAVVAGANEWPARPGVVDLRGRVQVLHVAVESASGRPLEDLRQALVPADAATLPDGLQVTDRDQPWIVQVEPPRDLLVAAHGFVPVRVPRPTADLRLSLQPCTTVELRPTTAATVGVAIRVVVDGVDDAVLRAFDSNANQRESGDLLQDGQALELRFAPGTELELVASCQGVTAAPRRVLVGAGGAQVVLVP